MTQTLKLTFRDLDKQVCSLNWARRLCEIGVRQDTYFHWIYDEKNDKWEVSWTDYFDEDDMHFAAFTAQDFVDLFPRLFKFARNDNEWKFYCEAIDAHMQDEEKLADVFARILIALTKNKNEAKKGLLVHKKFD